MIWNRYAVLAGCVAEHAHIKPSVVGYCRSIAKIRSYSVPNFRPFRLVRYVLCLDAVNLRVEWPKTLILGSYQPGFAIDDYTILDNGKSHRARA